MHPGQVSYLCADGGASVVFFLTAFFHSIAFLNLVIELVDTYETSVPSPCPGPLFLRHLLDRCRPLKLLKMFDASENRNEKE